MSNTTNSLFDFILNNIDRDYYKVFYDYDVEGDCDSITYYAYDFENEEIVGKIITIDCVDFGDLISVSINADEYELYNVEIDLWKCVLNLNLKEVNADVSKTITIKLEGYDYD